MLSFSVIFLPVVFCLCPELSCHLFSSLAHLSYRSQTRTVCRLFEESQALRSNPPKCHVVSAFHQGVKFPEEPGGVSYSLWVSDKKGMLWLQSHKYSEVSCKMLETSVPLGKRTSRSAVSVTRRGDTAETSSVFNTGCNLFCFNLFVFKLSPENCTYINECSPVTGLCIHYSPRDVSSPHQVFMDVTLAFQ